MAEEVRMPSLGQTTDELRIVKWFKGEGDPVEIGEPLLEVETDKATLEVESAVAGTVLKIVAQDGEVVQAGSLVAYVGRPGEPTSPVVGPAVRVLEADRDATVGASPPRNLRLGDGAPELLPAGHGWKTDDRMPTTNKVLASPAARQLAKIHGIELGDVRGSGPGGRIEKEDVLRLLRDQEKET